MKKKNWLLLELLIVTFALIITFMYMFPHFIGAQNLNHPDRIPDPEFRRHIEYNMKIHQGEVFTKKQAAELTNLAFRSKNVTDLKGLEYFTGLEHLEIYFDNNPANITTLDLSFCPNLKTLQLSSQQISTVDIHNCKQLIVLEISSESISQLDIKDHSNLQSIEISAPLTKIDLSNKPELRVLSVSNAKITSLPLHQLPNLESLSCNHLGLTELDVSGNTNLKYINCRGNQISELDISHNKRLKNLSVDWNPIRNIDLSQNKEIVFLRLSHCRLSNIDLSKNLLLRSVNLSNNYFTEMPDITNQVGLTGFDINMNNLNCRDVLTIQEYQRKLPATDIRYYYQNGMDLSGCLE